MRQMPATLGDDQAVERAAKNWFTLDMPTAPQLKYTIRDLFTPSHVHHIFVKN